MSVVVYGEPGSGKTKHAEILRSGFGCEKIVDEAVLGTKYGVNDLVLTSDVRVPYDYTLEEALEFID